MSEHYDKLETRAPDVREAAQFRALRDLLALAKAKAPGWSESLADVDPAAITDRAALAKLPVTRKSALVERQKAQPPFAGLVTLAPGHAAQLFASPGPIYELEAAESDHVRMARALFAAGFRAGDVVLNTFAYHLTPGGWIMHAGARALGCAVIPGGTGQSEQQAQAIAHLRPSGYGGTPDFLKVVLDKGKELGLDVSSIRRALVSGGALFPSLRAEYAERGVAVMQCYATAEAGLIAYESAGAEHRPLPGMVIDEGVIVEIVRPGTGDPVPEGEVGEVLVTTLNPAYPLVRLATGDLSAILEGASACGRTNRRIKGWMGRADQTTKVKGMFVHPEQVAEIAKRHAEVARARLVVGRAGDADTMTLRCEVRERRAGLADAIATSVRDLTKLRGEVELVEPGTLPNDGKVIEDVRDYAK